MSVSLSRSDSSTGKLIKLGVKFVDLALGVLLLHQMLESGSPVVLIVIFTFIVVSNALSCAAMMFIPYERAPLAEIFVDILYQPRGIPPGWFEQDALVIADPAETAIIYQTLKTLRVMSGLNLFTRIGVNSRFAFVPGKLRNSFSARRSCKAVFTPSATALPPFFS
ncbi:hypothetical protein V7S43_015164 [Phytophthora oleae]|uniref:Reticulon domain-containing protein n=1 Tax=Phytophthora oleae TaxID=2107226 RepID=A0ABD3F016_9STRA